MRITGIILGLFFCITLQINAQGQTKNNSVKQAKINFFNENLKLSKTEAEKFWPIYNDYQNRKARLSNERRNIMQYYSENQNNMTADEISQNLDRYIEIEKEETKLLEEYNKKFKQIMADEKVLKIYITEIQFRDYLLKQLRTGTKDIKLRK